MIAWAQVLALVNVQTTKIARSHAMDSFSVGEKGTENVAVVGTRPVPRPKCCTRSADPWLHVVRGARYAVDRTNHTCLGNALIAVGGGVGDPGAASNNKSRGLHLQHPPGARARWLRDRALPILCMPRAAVCCVAPCAGGVAS